MSIIAAGTTTTTALSSTGNTDGTLQLQVNGTTPSVTLNTLGAVGVGSTPNFGTAGQALVSGGSTAAPTWTTIAASQWTTSGSNIYYSAGNVGVLNTNPIASLDIGSGDSTTKFIAVRYSSVPLFMSGGFDGTSALNTISSNTYANATGSGASWSSFQNTSYTASAVQLASSQTAGEIKLLTASAANTAPTERFRIGSAGQFGIGGATYGTSGQVLTSGGSGAAPTWASPSSAMTLISTTTASSSSTVDITSGFTSTYDMYMVVITNMTVSATSTAAFWAQMYIGGSLQTSLYSYNYGFMDTGGYVTSGFTTSSPGDSRMYLAASGIIAQVGAPRTINAVFYIPNPSSTSVNKYMYGSGTTASATGGFRSYNFFTTAGYIGTGAMTGVSFYIQSGTIVTGKFRLYGISN